jgi:hypothetical protein
MDMSKTSVDSMPSSMSDCKSSARPNCAKALKPGERIRYEISFESTVAIGTEAPSPFPTMLMFPSSSTSMVMVEAMMNLLYTRKT